jgi:hypothetical protein
VQYFYLDPALRSLSIDFRTSFRPFRAFLFVIAPPCIIHGIMEPDGELHLFRMSHQGTGLIEDRETILDVCEIMIVAIRR